jgi:hypothetical protein
MLTARFVLLARNRYSDDLEDSVQDRRMLQASRSSPDKVGPSSYLIPLEIS